MRPASPTCRRLATRCPDTDWRLRATPRRLRRRVARNRVDRKDLKSLRSRGLRKDRRDRRDRRSLSRSAKGILFGGYARLVEAPNYAPSLRSVAGLLLALALESRLRGPPPPSLIVQRGPNPRERAERSSAAPCPRGTKRPPTRHGAPLPLRVYAGR